MKQIIQDFQRGFLTAIDVITRTEEVFNLKINLPRDTQEELADKIINAGEELTKQELKDILDTHADLYGRDDLVTYL